MKSKLILVVAVLGLLTVTEARFPKFSLSARRIEDPEAAAALDDKYEDDIEEKWRKYTKVEEDDDTVFHAVTLDSDIRGKKMYTLFQERTIYAYQGFRFGKAERFLPPVELDKYWGDDIFNATHIGLKCPQGGYAGLQPGGDEDCLFLNVYTPYKPGTTEAKNLTVMFFIYGGGFTFGGSATYMPTKLLNHDVILVTMHYRLGAFGFYTRDSVNAPGNLALYDMMAALRWVQRHITDFGGNPELVTIFGESAGSVSVNYMMLLTGKEDLFRGVIAESGSALDHWAIDLDKSDNGMFYATNYFENYVGCDTYTTEEEILDCMRKVPFQKLVQASHSLSTEDRKMGLLGFRGCSPTIQSFNDTAEVKKILYQEPREYILNREFKDVPFMTGANREEGSLIVGAMYHGYIIPNNLQNNATYFREYLLRDMLLAIGVKDEPMSIAKSMQKRYCGDIDLADLEVSQYCLIDIGGIALLKAGSWQMSNYHSYYSKHLTFYYSFEFDSDDSFGNWVVSKDSLFYTGITHADELQYIFAMPAIMDDYPGQKTVYERMIALWTNFARYLNPTPDEDNNWVDLDVPKWTPYLFEDPHFMVIDTNFTVLNDYSDRWTITNDQMGPKNITKISPSNELEEPQEPQKLQEPQDSQEPDQNNYEEKNTNYEITMIVFIVAFFIACVAATYFFFK